MEGGCGVLTNISCHMGWGLQCKECHYYILHPGLEFSDDLRLLHIMVYKSLIRRKFLGKAENELQGKLFFFIFIFYLQCGLKCDRLHHANIIMLSRI